MTTVLSKAACLEIAEILQISTDNAEATVPYFLAFNNGCNYENKEAVDTVLKAEKLLQDQNFFKRTSRTGVRMLQAVCKILKDQDYADNIPDLDLTRIEDFANEFC